MSNARSTSIAHYRTLDAAGWYSRIKTLMRKDPGRAWCIADLATELKAEKSTISARTNELFNFGEIEYAGDMPSRTTGIKSRHYKLKVQPTLL